MDGKVRLFGFLCFLPVQNLEVVERSLFKMTFAGLSCTDFNFLILDDVKDLSIKQEIKE